MKYARLALGSVLLVACKDPVAAAVDAGPPAVVRTAPPTVDAGRQAEAAPPNLLELVPSKIAVSSTVQNPRDFPEHLLDGKLDTAWNGKTGDLVGGWIRFRVPADAKVSYVELTAGYARVKGEEDLFLENHRIKRVQISHDGKVVGEHALDPSSRSMQRIPLAALCGASCGGAFELKVLEVEPGTKKEWRELVVSELRVVGEPGKTRAPEDYVPRIGVGSYDAYPPTLPPDPVALALPGPYADLAALCAAWPAIGKREYLESKESYEMFGAPKKGEPTCAEEPFGARFTPDATFLELKSLRLSDGAGAWSVPVLRTARGWSAIGYRYHEVGTPDPGCPSIVRPEVLDGQVTVQAGWLVIPTGSTQTQFDEPADSSPNGGMSLVLLRGALWCKEFAGSLACRAYHPQYQVPLGTKSAPASDPSAKQGWSAIPWKGETRITIDAAGALRIH